MDYTRRLAEISMDEVVLVGGKGASLGELARHGIPVPEGFVVTTHAHRHFNAHRELPPDLETEIARRLAAIASPTFAVRSSATVEDSSSASWAGQFETFLHIAPHAVIDALRQCWHSAKSGRVESYGRNQGIDPNSVSLAVVIQKMVPAHVSGVCFTVHPVTANPDEMLIEAVDGFGESLVSGRTTPDMYVMDKNAFSVSNKTYGDAAAQKLSDLRVIELARLCKKIEDLFGKPQDVEWAFDGEHFHIVQARPITTI